MSSSKNWDLQIDPSVYRVFKKVPRHDAEAILEVIRLLPADPYFGDVKKMKGEINTWRRRVGSYRVFYRIKISEKIILVFCLKKRASNTY